MNTFVRKVLVDDGEESLGFAIDRLVAEVLAEAEIEGPPVDCLTLAVKLRLVVAVDRRQQARGRCARLASPDGGLQDAIFVRPEDRSERTQWTVAHELGEHFAHELFARLRLDLDDAGPGLREQSANAFANRLLVPTAWLGAAGEAADWDLPALKRRFATASHEVLARRMLDVSRPVIITIVDDGAVVLRRANFAARPPRPSPLEHRVRLRACETGRPADQRDDAVRVRAWPIHEPPRRREIVRLDVLEAFDVETA